MYPYLPEKGFLWPYKPQRLDLWTHITILVFKILIPLEGSGLMKAVQIGCGLVGHVIASDLARDYDVVVVDRDAGRLEALKRKLPQIETAQASATSAEELAPILEGADIVTAGVPGERGFEMMKTVIGLGRNLCDISFMAEDFDDLDGLARERDVTVVPDIGVAPGMSNFLMGRGASLVDDVEEAYIYVGGIPQIPEPPFNYKATWSPLDCIDEFLRPARIIEKGRQVVVEAASGLHLKDFPGVGTLEVFYTDGLRSLAKNIRGKTVAEMTMRWPGHVEQMKLLRSMGLFDKKSRNLGGADVVPLDIAADLLLPMWKMEPERGDRDLTVMRVVVRGYRGRDEITSTWDLCDRFDEASWTSSMGRCTGCTCAIFARAVQKGLVKGRGVIAPELLAGDDELYAFVMAEQKKRGLVYRETTQIVRDAR